MSLRWYLKILSAFILVILVVVLPSTFYLGSNLKNFLMDQKEQELRRELKLAGQMVAEKFNTGPRDTAKMQNLALEVGADIQKRVTIISRDGRVLGDSDLTSEAIDKMEDHSNRAGNSGGQGTRGSVGVSVSVRPSRPPLFTGPFPFIKIITFPDMCGWPCRSARWKRWYPAFAKTCSWPAGLTGILAILLSFFLTWSINRPLREITGMVKRMADGDLKQPFHLLPKTEFRDLTSSLERMANELSEKMELLDIETNQLTTLLSNHAGRSFNNG